MQGCLDPTGGASKASEGVQRVGGRGLSVVPELSGCFVSSEPFGCHCLGPERADQDQMDRRPETALLSVGDLPAHIKDIPLVVSGSRALAETLSVELRRTVYWLSIGGNGATDPQAIWESWLAGVPSLSIELASLSRWQCQDQIGRGNFGCTRRLRPSARWNCSWHRLLLSNNFRQERVGDRTSLRNAPLKLLSSADPPLIRSWIRSFRVSLRIAVKTAFNRLGRAQLLMEQWSIAVCKNPTIIHE